MLWFISAIILSLSTFTSCKKFLAVEVPNSQISNDLVFANDIAVNAALAGIYLEMYSGPKNSFASGNHMSVTGLAGLLADELHNDFQADPAIIAFEENNLQADNVNVENLWLSMYRSIYQANAVLEGLTVSTGVTPEKNAQFRGEALFVRAFCHFYLVNLFGDVPIITSTDYRINSKVTRAPQSQVYDQIEADLLAADSLLSTNYLSGLRVRPNKSVAVALLARLYLYKKNWVNATANATKIISQTAMYRLPNDLDSVFLGVSPEAIWQLKPVDKAPITQDAYMLSRTGNDNNSLTDTLVNSFPDIDHRKVHWITSSGTLFLPYKYKLYQPGTQPSTEYSMVFRLAEQYLIRAEARAKLGAISGDSSAISDINIIRRRAGLPDTTANNINEIMGIIERERKSELFTEWGHRWFDLKRWHRSTAVLGSLKTEWTENDTICPIPQSELNRNPYIKMQNSGY